MNQFDEEVEDLTSRFCLVTEVLNQTETTVDEQALGEKIDAVVQTVRAFHELINDHEDELSEEEVQLYRARMMDVLDQIRLVKEVTGISGG